MLKLEMGKVWILIYLWGHHVKKPSVDLAPEVTVAITIRKWNIFATVDYFERANGKKIEKENAEKVI